MLFQIQMEVRRNFQEVVVTKGRFHRQLPLHNAQATAIPAFQRGDFTVKFDNNSGKFNLNGKNSLSSKPLMRQPVSRMQR